MTKSRPLIDTDEQKAIDDAVERAAFSEMEIKQMATDACEVFHEKHCPAKDLGGKLDKFVGEFDHEFNFDELSKDLKNEIYLFLLKIALN